MYKLKLLLYKLKTFTGCSIDSIILYSRQQYIIVYK